MKNGDIYFKMFLYIFVTMLITFLSLLDTITDVNNLSNFEWIKIIAKSSIPGLISLKAYLDTSSNNSNNNNIK
jgi:hypothetical protein